MGNIKGEMTEYDGICKIALAVNAWKSYVSDFHDAFFHHFCRLVGGEAGKQLGLKKHGDSRTENGVTCGFIRKGTRKEISDHILHTL